MNNEIKVSLIIRLEGSVRIPNSDKKEILHSSPIIERDKEGKVISIKSKDIVRSTYQTKDAIQVLNLTEDAYNFFISRVSVPYEMNEAHWATLSKKVRLEYHLKRIAQSLGGTVLQYKVLE